MPAVLGGGGCVRGRTALLALVAAVAIASCSPALGGQGQGRNHVVTLTETERLDGTVETATFSCPEIGACVGLVHVEIFGGRYDYLLSAVASDDRVSLIFRGRTPVTPALNYRQGYPVGVPLAPDGTGQRDVALAALRGPEPRTTVMPRTGTGHGWLSRAGTPVANIRVTVRREDAAERSR